MHSDTPLDKFVYIDTFGCQMNDSDTERLLAFLAGSFKETRDPELADLIILNTCTVRDKAEQKVYSAAGKFKGLKKKKKDLIFAICGCVAQQEGERLLKRIPHLDLVFGPDSVHRIGEMLSEIIHKKQRITETKQRGEIDPYEYGMHAPARNGVKALVNIMRGCDNFCSYCIVPHTRGREVSRAPVEIIEEIKSLTEAGVKEVTLLGQNVNSYTGGKAGERTSNFPELLASVCALDAIERVRFVTSHPKDISPELTGLFVTEDKLARHIHLPVQSGSDRVLEMMGRGYSASDYLDKIDRFKALGRGVSITTDVIVGFPGESENDFEQTMDLIEEVRFDNIFSFIYSPRPGTEAAGFDGQLTDNVKKERLAELQKRQMEITMEASLRFVGTRARVLVEGKSVKDARELTGRSSVNRVINFPGSMSLVGELIDVTITKAFANSLRGECI